MEGLEKILFDASREALEKYNDAKLQYILAEREMWAAVEAYRAYTINKNGKQKTALISKK